MIEKKENRLVLRISEQMADSLDLLAKTTGRPVSEIVRVAIIYAARSMQDEDGFLIPEKVAEWDQRMRNEKIETASMRKRLI